MPDWLSDWGFWGVVLAALGLIAAIAIPYWLHQRNRKRLGFEVRSNVPVIGASVVDQSEWDIQYKGNPLRDPYVMEVQLENIGRVPIRAEDFESGKPIKISSTNGALFVAISQESTYPGELSLNPELAPDEIRVSPMLLNPGEGFRLTVVTVRKCVPEPSARIAGLDRGIEGVPEKRSVWDIVAVAITTIIVVTVAVDVGSGGLSTSDVEQIFLLGGMTAIIMLFIIGSLSRALLRLYIKVRDQ